MRSFLRGRGVLPALAGFFALSAPPGAHADLDFVQVLQAQTSRGREGLFGKSWFEVRGDKMRVVSGYARKLRRDASAVGPRRVVQILDLGADSRILLYPGRKAYARAPLVDVDYGNRMAGVLDRGASEWRIARAEIRLSKMPQTRELLGAECAHYHIAATLSLTAPGGRGRTARMEQNVWVAPIAGDLSTALLDLIGFENAYRKATGGSLSPLDHERYQVREAAAYLRVPESELRDVVERVRQRFRELPSYPVASSVSWWRGGPVDRPARDGAPPPDPGRGEPVSLGDVRPHPPGPSAGRRSGGPREPEGPGTPAAPEAASVPSRTRRPPAPRFRIIDWRATERKINRMYDRTRSEFGEFPLGRLASPPRSRRRSWQGMGRRRPVVSRVYPRFEDELNSILAELLDAERVAAQTLAEAEKKRRLKDQEAPFYEIYTELHGLEGRADVSPSDFRLPSGYAEVPYAPPAKAPPAKAEKNR
ncbi:MAG: hypothetical protein ABII00_15010 [Elusimicrobiota bacterium]